MKKAAFERILKRADYTPSELRQEWQNSLALRKPGKGSTGRLLDALEKLLHEHRF